MRFGFLIFIVLIPTVVSLEISEIMYNPQGSDNNLEFIEIFDSEGVVDLTGFTVGDLNSNDTVKLLNNYSQSTFALIVEEGFNYSAHDVPVYSAGATIGNNLNNDEDRIMIWNTTLIASAEYNESMGADGNGRSLVLRDGVFVESGSLGGSPGRENNATIVLPTTTDVSITVNIDGPLYTLIEYDKLFKIVNNRPEFGPVTDIVVDYSIKEFSGRFVKERINQFSTTETGRFTLYDVENVTLCATIVSSEPSDGDSSNNHVCQDFSVIDAFSRQCDVELSVATARQVYYDNESVKIEFTLTNDSFPYVIQYHIEDLFGSIVKKQVETKNMQQKSYSPTLKEQDRALMVIGDLQFVACNNSGSQLHDEKLIVIRSAGQRPDRSTLSISKVYVGSDDRVMFGETFRIRLDVYKGNSTKKAVKAYVVGEDGVKVSQVNVNLNFEQNYQRYDVTIPIHLKPNCNRKFQDGVYEVVIEGLDASFTSSVTVKGISPSTCDTTTIVKRLSTTSKRKRFDAVVMGVPEVIRPGESFDVDVKIRNDHEDPVELSLWSYVYRGPTSFSGERKGNLKELVVGGESEKVVALPTIVDAAMDDGNYKMKVVLNKNNQKTNTELVENIIVETNVFEEIVPVFTQLPQEYGPVVASTKLRKNPIIYRSSARKQVAIVPYLLVVVVLLFTVVVWKKY